MYNGRLTERLIVPAWKAVRCNSHTGSNPVPTANFGHVVQE
jgi:hypothetical protein